MDHNLEELLRSTLLLYNSRFDKLESKIDSLSEVVILLAKVETKLAALEESRIDQGRRLGHLETISFEVKEETNSNTAFRGTFTKAFWIIIAAAATVSMGVYLT